MEAELTVLDVETIKAEWIHGLLTDFPTVEKQVPSILVNYDNWKVVFKVNSSKGNMKSLKHVKRTLKSVRKQKTIEFLCWIMSKWLRILQILSQKNYQET
jgi:hypothetical protein